MSYTPTGSNQGPQPPLPVPTRPLDGKQPMTTSPRKSLRLALVLPLVAALAGAVLAVGPAPAQATPAHYNPTKGVTFNNPYGTTAARFRIVHKLVQTINSVKTGHKIRIASWNFRSPSIANALIAAHKRGVSVRILMDYGNWNPDVPNNIAQRTHHALAQGDKHRPHDMTSWLKRCKGSCRGPHGIAHTKFYLFDKVQNTRDVVMYGSVNATTLAATIQWNDLYTFTGAANKYTEFLQVFNQMRADKAVAQGYLHYVHGPVSLDFYPYTGAGTSKDPVLTVLNQIRCTGATGGTGINGHTVVRIAQTSTYGDRGLALAKRLAQMERRGCNIRVVYAMFGGKVLQILRGSHVPMTHLAYDADCNGIYDKYLHMKSMTVNGVYGTDTSARITWNGSSNWTSISLASDEVVGTLQIPRVTRIYSNWIDYLFTHVPAAWKPQHCTAVVTGGTVGDRSMATHGSLPVAPVYKSVAARARALGVDPYALIRKDL